MFQKVQDGEEFVGTLYLRENVSYLSQQLLDYVKIASLMMLCSLLASGLLAVNLQRAVSKPILALARTAVEITTAGDYSIRVRQQSRDELGTLYDAFNKMLERVETSEKQLLAAQNVLEEKVLERTAQLRNEIAEKERAQAELERSKDAAESATHSKSEFLANMSHEIRTPITAILGFVEVLLEEQQGDWGKEELATIQRNGEHLLAIINDILDISKIEARRMSVERIPCSPLQLIADVNSLMHVRASAKGLALRVEFHTSIPETIQTDPTRVRQILLNLIGNAIKFTEIGEIKLVVSFLPGDRAHDAVRCDRHGNWHDGKGIAKSVPAILPGRNLHHTPVRRHGLGTGHQQTPGRDARRRCNIGEIAAWYWKSFPRDHRHRIG